MNTGKPVFEKSRSVQDMQHMRLMALLNELVRDKGVMKATQLLGVDYKTLTASMERGRLSRRMRSVLEKALLEGGGLAGGRAAGAQRQPRWAADGGPGPGGRAGQGHEQGPLGGPGRREGDGGRAGPDGAAAGASGVGPGRSGRSGRARRIWEAQAKREVPRCRREFPDLVTRRACRRRRGRVRERLAPDRRVAGAEGRAPQPTAGASTG